MGRMTLEHRRIVIMIVLIFTIVLMVNVHGRDVPMNKPLGAIRTEAKPPLPQYLLGTSDDVKNAYYDLIGNDALTINEQKNGIEQLAAKNNLMDEYYAHEDQESYTKQWLSVQLDDVLRKLPDIKLQLDTIMKDNQLTTVSQNKKLLDINRKNPNEIAIINYIVNQVLVSATTRQGQFTTKTFGGSKVFGDFDKSNENRGFPIKE